MTFLLVTLTNKVEKINTFWFTNEDKFVKMWEYSLPPFWETASLLLLINNLINNIKIPLAQSVKLLGIFSNSIKFYTFIST